MPQQPQTKHLVIDKKLHDTIKFYCFCTNKQLRDYVEHALSNMPEIKEFSASIKKYKRLK